MKQVLAVTAMALFLSVACNQGDTVLKTTVDAGDLAELSAADAGGEGAGADADAAVPPHDATAPDDAHAEWQDLTPELDLPQCKPGEGCFMDKCTQNGQCQAGWCMEHLGEGVCALLCEEECPDGWECRTVGAGGPDVVSVCVSGYANLCKPCSTNADCKSPGGADDVCLDYGTEGRFCGGACGAQGECPWGFTCKDAVTAEGVSLQQCVADTGVCPCTGKSVALALATPCEVKNDHGVCAGMRVCTAEGLSPCDASVPVQETCNAADDDCDGQTDEPLEVAGDYVNLCDDQNECTQDMCIGEAGCSSDILDSGECKDGDACTAGDHCEAGQCVGAPVLCDDQNPCTDDACDGQGGCLFTANAADCNDFDPCTVADECSDSVCAGFPVACDCLTDADCTAFDDGDVCTGKLFCDHAEVPYKCAVTPGSPVVCPPPPPGPDAICLKPACDPVSGGCSFVPNHEGLACEDGNACTIGDMCQDGSCISGVAATCADDNPCTDDACSPVSGCIHTANNASCNDGNTCTVGDHCAAAMCAAGAPLPCDDGNICNGLESCDLVQGCKPGKPLVCDDGNLCNGLESCDKLLGCKAGKPLACDDGNPCNGVESCDKLLGCQPAQFPGCDDGNACTVDSCDKLLGCQHKADPAACNDGNPCTDDSCSPAAGCLHQPNAAACDDGNACTLGDHCALAKCTYDSLQKCEDDNVCTTNTCDPAQGCIATLNSATCDDQDLCTTGDHCHLGACIGGSTLPCDDGNPCTDNQCDKKAGCQFLPNSAQCTDGDACTVGDACKNGWCAFTGFKSCDDGKVCNGMESCNTKTGCVPGVAPELTDNVACTFDFCDEAAGGVVHAPQDAACSDGKYCTGQETCSAATGCVPGVPVPVDDKVACTIDVCDEDNDLVTHTPDHAACSDSNVCTGLETCDPVKGCVAGTPLTCTDGLACTTDSCDPAAGCLFAPVDALCDDVNPCTTDSCKAAAGCLHPPVQDATPCTGGSGPGKCQAGVCVPDCAGGSKTFDCTSGPVTFQVPSGCAGQVTIEAWGAQAGDEETGIGGKGARVKGTFAGLAGKTLEIRVGCQGYKGTCSICGGGGGGGSFVWIQGASDPLLIAGGGGGASLYGANGYPGLTTQQGGAGGYSPAPIGQGGYSDNGGGGGTGAGGGGWLSDGTGNSWTTGGAAKGGPGGQSKGYTGHGGYGGGGASYHGGGGGGGYSGGSGGTYPTGGGGGGSFNAGSNQSADSGVRSGNGQISISWQ